jgi:hypothetical protein
LRPASPASKNAADFVGRGLPPQGRAVMRIVSLLAVLVIPCLPQLTASAACADPLKLNEICAGPARDWDGNGVFSSRDDEWVEVANTGADALDLGAYVLTDGDGIPRFGFSGTLAPGGHRVVFGSESVAWERATSHPVFGLSLANTGDQVRLLKVTGPDTLVVDSYAYQAHEAAADRASGRLADGDGPWVLFDGLNPYSGTTPPAGNGCAPSPGAINECGSTPTHNVTWGRIKTLYR